jgi:hypothetical protein
MVLSTPPDLRVVLRSFLSRRKMGPFDFVSTSGDSTKSPRKTTAHFLASPTSSMFEDKEVCLDMNDGEQSE